MPPSILVSNCECLSVSQTASIAGMEVMNVLVVSKSGSDAGYLREQLESRGCRCWGANSMDELAAIADRQRFDLILSASWLPDQTLSKLKNSKSTVFFSFPVRNGCWWLPVLERGRHCLGEPALRGNEFAVLIAQWLKKIRRLSATAA